MLTFDEAKHEYRKDGRVVPHVTGVLAPLVDYSMVKPEQLEIARQKGVAVHAMVQHDAAGTLNDLPDWMVPVYDYWLKLKAEAGLEIIASEKRVYHSIFGYAGTLDLRVIAHKLRGLKGHGIIDVKRSFMGGAVIGLQTAAYEKADDASGDYGKEKIQWRGALRLREDMPPRMEFYEDKNDFNVYLALLTIKRWKEQHQ